MARARTPDPLPKPPPGFVASAVRLPNVSRNKAGRAENWQQQAWGYWETVGELRYVATWIGNVLSRARLVAAERDGRMLVPIQDPTHPAVVAVDALYGGPQGQSEMLKAYGEHTTIAGEVYLVNRAKGDTWDMLASGKVTQQGAVLNADFGTEGGSIRLDPSDLVIRLWTPNPRDPTRPDSPVRSNLNTLAQITGYDAHINAQITSRLAGNGILFISSDVTFPTPPPGPGDEAVPQSPANAFMQMLGEAMMTPIGDPGDPSALVPIVAMVPTESLGKNEHIKFWSDLDDAVVEMRDAAIKRLALGMDVPPEVLLGVADTNHWNAWLSEESAVKAHLEPRLATLTFGLTEQYLQPALEGEVANPQDFFVIADTSSIRLRPNRSAEAVELYDRGELSGEALLRETGFQPEDAPGDEERKLWLLRKIASGSTSPEQTAAALSLLGLDIGLGIGGEVNRQPADQMRTDTAPALPLRNAPDFDAARDFYMDPATAACGALVYRALERAGNRLRNLHPRIDTAKVAAVDLYRHVAGDPDTLLAGAWDCAPDVLSPYTTDVEGMVSVLDFYVRGLLGSKREHSNVVMSALIASRPRPLERVT